MLRLSDFDYCLPKELIAQFPLKKRDSARLLVLNRKNDKISHFKFSDLGNFLEEGDSLVLNDTKVLPSRIIARRRSGGKVELLLVKRLKGLTFSAMVKPSRLKVKETVIINGGKISAEIISRDKVRFKAKNLRSIYERGNMPLPPYIKREARDSDCEFYQTVYARNKGAIASPTAGLHFTDELLDKIAQMGINLAFITLHVGTGTFRPVKAQDIRKHEMEGEYFNIPSKTKKILQETIAARKKIIAVGTTSCRALEAYAGGNIGGKTELFIYPGYKFKIVDKLLTNFHLPRTTLFMMVCAFAGSKLIKKAYGEAIKKRYRFYSYGDAMLVI